MKFKLTILVFFVVARSYGQDYTSIGLNQLNWYDFKNSSFNSSVALNCYLWYVNFGADYRFSNPVNSKSGGEFLFLGGVGYFNYYQIQLGKSNLSNSYLRQRTEWTLSELGLKPKSKSDVSVFNNITVSLFADKYLNDSRQNWLFGFGLGYSIRATGILH